MATERKLASAIAFIIALLMPAVAAAQAVPADDRERALRIAEMEYVNKLQRELNAARREIELLESRVETMEAGRPGGVYYARLENDVERLRSDVRGLERKVDLYRRYLYALGAFSVIFAVSGGTLFTRARKKKAGKTDDAAMPAQE